MEEFADISGILLTVAAIFGLGWGVHAFFHRRNHDELEKKVAVLEEQLEDAKKNQKLSVQMKNYSPQEVEQITISDDELILLKFIEKEGVYGPPGEMGMSRAQLAGARLSEKGLIADTQDGMQVTRLGLEWMEKNNQLE